MTHIKVLFSHDKGDLVSRFMAWITYSKYSHVALLHGDRVIEASGVGHPLGVREVSYHTYMVKHPDAVIRRISHSAPYQVWQAAQSQICKDYDWNWLWGYLLHSRDWQDTSKWVCSELIAWACQEAGDPILTADSLWHVSPNYLYMVSNPND
jgi:uncharacterized protein YycO